MTETLLDKFAMAALNGFCANPSGVIIFGNQLVQPNYQYIASKSFEIAQAMLAEKQRIEKGAE